MPDSSVESTPEMNIPATPAAPTHVEVRIGNETFKVDPAVAKILQAAEANIAAQTGDMARTVNALQQELQSLKQAQANPQVGIDPDAFDYNTELFVNPKATLERFGHEVANRVRQELGAANQMQQAQAAFWDSFYTQNDDLKAHDWFVKALLSRDYAKLRDLPADKAIEKLSETAKGELLKMGVGKDLKPGKGKPAAEGGNEPTPARSKVGNGADTVPGSLSAVLRARAEARRKHAS